MKYHVVHLGFCELANISNLTLEGALTHISAHNKGWDSLDQLHNSIRRWGETAKAGDVFATSTATVVCTGGRRSRNRNQPQRSNP